MFKESQSLMEGCRLGMHELGPSGEEKVSLISYL